MIRNSFIILPRIGRTREAGIWKQGITDWQGFRDTKKIKGMSRSHKSRHDRFLSTAAECLHSSNTEFFTYYLPRIESWRLYNLFKDEAVYLDIETSFDGDITVVGMYDSTDTKTMIKGINLDAKNLKQYLQRFKLIMTFNGSSFDLPILNKYYPGCIPRMPHMDLMHCCRRIGLTGGLKKIEKKLGIARDEEVEHVVGSQAPLLWRHYKATGDEHYLRLLVKYNDEDVINLKPLAEHAYGRLSQELRQNYLNPQAKKG
ncbi:MAG: ribonuclease H-like domain-containing protein [Nanoarchaeota archaeon]|nr:ribonuclease H-like domain-containing protein [Nanoarchaeota archaeon]